MASPDLNLPKFSRECAFSQLLVAAIVVMTHIAQRLVPLLGNLPEFQSFKIIHFKRSALGLRNRRERLSQLRAVKLGADLPVQICRSGQSIADGVDSRAEIISPSGQTQFPIEGAVESHLSYPRFQRTFSRVEKRGSPVHIEERVL